MRWFVVAVFLFGFAGCEEIQRSKTPDAVQAKATQKALSEAMRQVGMPNIVNFTELKLAKMIAELRDSEGLRTWTYIKDMHGKLHFLTESIGYGLPYCVQMTNPERIYSEEHHSGGDWGTTMPQAEPNGLFMPEGLSATWVIAVTEDGPKPAYIEPEICVFPFRMPGVDHGYEN